ncbi:hypothetical protein HU200_041527 [Digitaria exilis]|uniref:Uncharacterized protein n=1 Tax=Digitaria exilis TaxID=1010633 RepID=A0A835B6P6_9POAL|nr:hypothetical protein HU200_041527 [Digitaria exilis]
MGRGGGGGGFGCRLRLFPRHCTSSATAATAREHVAAAAKGEMVGGQTAPHEESPRTSHGLRAGKNSKATVAVAAEDALPAASLGLGASLVLLLSKSAAELSRMAELRAQMERLMLDVRADVRNCNGRPSSGSGDHTDSSSVVVKGAIVGRAGDEGSRTAAAPVSRGRRENAGQCDMDRMEAELEAELSRMQDDFASPRRDRELETEAKSRSASSRCHSVICSGSEDDNGVDDDGSQDCDGEDEEEEDHGRGDDDGESDGKSMPPHGGVSARELERRLHELLQSRHEARIAELESELDRARRKLRETEREASRWRDTAKLATRFTDESRLR